MQKKDEVTMSHIIKTSEMVHQQMEAIQAEIDQTIFVTSAGNDAVKLSLNGKHALIDVQFSDDALRLPAGALSILIIEAHNGACEQIAKATRQKIISLADHLSES
jgi:DNA-binding protein YbaB